MRRHIERGTHLFELARRQRLGGAAAGGGVGRAQHSGVGVRVSELTLVPARWLRPSSDLLGGAVARRCEGVPKSVTFALPANWERAAEVCCRTARHVATAREARRAAPRSCKL